MSNTKYTMRPSGSQEGYSTIMESRVVNDKLREILVARTPYFQTGHVHRALRFYEAFLSFIGAKEIIFDEN